MQRRAAAMYFVFFVVIGAAAYGLIATASQPQISFSGQAYAENATATLGGQSYTISSIKTETSGGGGHGGTATTKIVGKVSWQDTDATFTAELKNGSTQTYRGEEYVLVTRPDESMFQLREQRNVSRILAADDTVYDTTATVGGQTVVVRKNDTTVPLSTYLPARETLNFSVGDTFPYKNQTATIDSVTADKVTLSWTGVKDKSVELSQHENVTLGGTSYFVHFPNDQSVKLLEASQAYSQYESQLAVIDYYHERINGLWGVSILSAIAAIILLATAYLPTRG